MAAPWLGHGATAAAAGYPSAAAWQWQFALLQQQQLQQQQQQQMLAWSRHQQLPGAGWGAAALPWVLPPPGFPAGMHPPPAASAAGWALGSNGASAAPVSGGKRSRHELQPQPTSAEAAAKRARTHMLSELGAAGSSALSGVPSGAAGQDEGQDPSALGVSHASGVGSGRRRVSFQQPPIAADDLAVEGSRSSDGAGNSAFRNADATLRHGRPSATYASAPGLQADLIAAAAGAVGALAPGGDDPLSLVQAVCAAMTATFAAILERRGSSAGAGVAESARGGIRAAGAGGVLAEELDTQAVVAEAPGDDGP
jgi:hypothetical protein